MLTNSGSLGLEVSERAVWKGFWHTRPGVLSVVMGLGWFGEFDTELFRANFVELVNELAKVVF